MESLVLHPTSQAQWHSLINEASITSGISLQEELESYLVFLLMRYTSKPELINSVLALEFLAAHQLSSTQRYEILRDLGDKCLLFSGLFPGCAQRKRVKISYFVKLGRCAYACLTEVKAVKLSILYGKIYETFVPMMDILQCTRQIGEQKKLTPLQIFDLWNDTQSSHALNQIKASTHSLPVHAKNWEEKSQ